MSHCGVNMLCGLPAEDSNESFQDNTACQNILLTVMFGRRRPEALAVPLAVAFVSESAYGPHWASDLPSQAPQSSGVPSSLKALRLMEGRKPSPQNKNDVQHQRPGSLSSGFLSQTQRPGRLNGGTVASQPLVKQEDQPGPSNGSAKGSMETIGSSEIKPNPRKIFRPNVPAKNDPRKRSASGAASSSAAAKDSEAFRELIKQAQSDKGWQDKARQNRPQHAPIHAAPIGHLPASSTGQTARSRSTGSFPAPSRGLMPSNSKAGASRASGSLVPVREDVVMSDDDDSEEGKVLGPMLDYTRYYPTTLPLHQPRHDSSEASTASDEGNESMADKLQLLGDGAGKLLVLVQVPDLLPSAAPPPAPDLAAARQRSLRRDDQLPAAIAQGLKALPSGKIGQLVVYESGAVKMQIGSVLYDLEPGISPNIREEIAAISMGEEPACPFLGEVQQHAVITPDMEHLLSGQPMPKLLPEPGLWKPPEKEAVAQDSVEAAAPMDMDVKLET